MEKGMKSNVSASQKFWQQDAAAGRRESSSTVNTRQEPPRYRNCVRGVEQPEDQPGWWGDVTATFADAEPWRQTNK